MRFLIGIIIVVLVFLGLRTLFSHWHDVHNQPRPGYQQEAPPTPTAPVAQTLPGLPAHLESSLAAATRQGAGALRVWLNQNRRHIQDPRLAAIELDYVVLVAGMNFGEAREVFAAVKQRTPTNSPVYPAIRRLERAYD
jgi:hypothetical protein